MSTQTYTPVNYQYPMRLGATLSDHVNRSEATISQWIVGHARLFSRLREGKGCNAHTYQDVMQWFSDNWPADLEWPQDVPRPSKNKETAA